MSYCCFIVTANLKLTFLWCNFYSTLFSKVFRYNQSGATEIDCVAFHQCAAWYIFFVSSSSLKVTVTFLLIRWSNDEGLICCDQRAARSRALSLSGSPLYFISLFCASVSPRRLLSVSPRNLMWGCSLLADQRQPSVVCQLPLRRGGRWDEIIYMHIGERERAREGGEEWDTRSEPRRRGRTLKETCVKREL